MKQAPLLLAATLLLLAPPRAKAQFLAPNSGGTVLNALFEIGTSHTPNQDEGIAIRDIGFPFTYYGQSYSTLSVSTNGLLSFNLTEQDAWPANFELPIHDTVDRPAALYAPPRIYGLWDDLTINAPGDSGGSITETKTENHYAVTYDVDSFGNLAVGPLIGKRQQFQMILFGHAETLSGFSFLPGDIAFVYQRLEGPFDTALVSRNDFVPDGRPDSTHGVGTATLGLHEGLGSAGRFATLSGLPVDGVIDDSQKTLVKRFSDQGKFYLFRFDGQNYVSSIQSASAPEPSALTLLLLGAFPTMCMLRHRACGLSKN